MNAFLVAREAKENKTIDEAHELVSNKKQCLKIVERSKKVLDKVAIPILGKLAISKQLKLPGCEIQLNAKKIPIG